MSILRMVLWTSLAASLSAQQRFGLTCEGLLSRPTNDLYPGARFKHAETSISLLTGLSGDSASRLWPYLGLDLGAICTPHITPSPLSAKSFRAADAHYSLGFLHRPGALDRKQEIQGSFLFGLTWQAKRPMAKAAPARPTPEVLAPLLVVVAPPPLRPLLS